jgi:hypothetical protein
VSGSGDAGAGAAGEGSDVGGSITGGGATRELHAGAAWRQTMNAHAANLEAAAFTS